MILTLTQSHHSAGGLLEITTALGPTITAVLVLGLGVAQFLASRAQANRQQAILKQQVRLGLFDRRQEVYQRFRTVQSELFARLDCSRETATEATALHLDSIFLFPDDVVEFLKRFQHLAWDLHCWASLHEAALRNDHSQVQPEIQRRARLAQAVSDSYEEATRLFRSAMAIDI